MHAHPVLPKLPVPPPHLLLDVGGEVGSVQLQRLHQPGVSGQQLQDGGEGAVVGTEPVADLAEAGLLRVGTAGSGGARHSPAAACRATEGFELPQAASKPAGLRPASSWQGWATSTHRLEGAAVALLQRRLRDAQVLPHQQQLFLLAQLESVTLRPKGTGSGWPEDPAAPRQPIPGVWDPTRRTEGTG